MYNEKNNFLNQSGVIEDKPFHKNAKYNLEVLCKKYNQEEHVH
jgi:hypothetical protein